MNTTPKKTLLFVIASFMVLITFSIPFEIQGSSMNAVSVYMQKQAKLRPEKDVIPEEGHRMPSRPITCYISIVDGIIVSNLDEEIITFEIWSSNGSECVALFNSEHSFITQLFSLHGDYSIRFQTENYNLTGYISL